LVSQRLAGKPAAEEATTDCARHVGARRLGAAGEKPIRNMGQPPDPLKAVNLDISPCSRVGHRFNAIASRQIVVTQSRDVELSRNWQTEDDPSAFACGGILPNASARGVVWAHRAVL